MSQYTHQLFAVILSLFATSGLPAQETPRLSISALHVRDGESIDVSATGFTPGRSVFSHLRKPDQTEYPVLLLYANARGEVSHTIDTLLLLPGIHELWWVDETSRAVSNRVRFTVGFGGASPATPEVEAIVKAYAGVWRGTGGRNVPPVSSTVLLSLTGRTGGVAGTIAYPGLSCGGLVGFRTVYRDAIELSETITYGGDRCTSNGVATVKFASDGSMSFQWSHPKLSGATSGSLTAVKE